MSPTLRLVSTLRPLTLLAVTALVAVAVTLPRPSGAQTASPAASLAAPPAPPPSCPAGMAGVAGGTFTMGEREVAATAAVSKLAKVTVPPFCMDVTEVTVDRYAACATSGACTADHPGQWTADGATFAADAACNFGVSGKGNHPMNCVDWAQSTAYCRARGKRLPTEEEWEWAARGGREGRPYPWGDAVPSGQLCWSGVTRRSGTCAVGSFVAGDALGGIHDLAGDVWEWTSSNDDLDTRVRRGGGWINDDRTSPRTAHRGRSAAAFRTDLLGFRCVQSP